ncbi:hypothetical protein D3C74_477970 [compost metagenome]
MLQPMPATDANNAQQKARRSAISKPAAIIAPASGWPRNITWPMPLRGAASMFSVLTSIKCAPVEGVAKHSSNQLSTTKGVV